MLQLALASLNQPREAIAEVIRTEVSQGNLIRGALFIACVSGLFDAASRAIAPLPEPFGNGPLNNPLIAAGIQFFGIMVVAFLTDRVGRFFGGTGTYIDALKVSVWFSFLWLFGVALVLLVMLLAPPLAPLVQLAMVIWMLIIFTSFVQGLHGFEKFFVTLAGVFGVGLALSMITVMALGALGIFDSGVPQNV